MIRTRNWAVDIAIDEDAEDRRTHAVAVLRSEGRLPVRGEGTARRAPRDREVPEIGDELATSRALSDLAYQLLDATASDIEEITHRPAHLYS
ncbi:DUF1876 domain-containing protein [Actinoplanes regularis]|uniref:DUF1876 domain-containing protein n=1 Tax=Actinoplanes regularis TaxID=52697 RepID=A0A239K596_9ACTN|nr:DUF1876 domain-containing protein [Actinoplanes regularis]GIE92410.1 hypothetical protein Are01nite_88900 [Actinoplanes regularis]GLW35781.1 hypothetical protein Areg01_87160 [Actinoplanes regularis]SNT12958.1 protein of unknown function [Actinoplanes regularis]